MMNSKLSFWLYVIGLVIVFGSHIYMLIAGLPANMMMQHAVLNLVAGCLIVVGCMKKEA